MHEIAHLAHVELRTPAPDESLEFFTGYLGLTATGTVGDSVFLRAWDDYEQATIKLTAHVTSGVGRTNLRAASPEALERRVKEIQASGRGIGWADGDPGYGPTYIFSDPGRLHHIAFAVDSREGILRAADLALDHGVFIETGPQPVDWTEAERAKGQA